MARLELDRSQTRVNVVQAGRFTRAAGLAGTGPARGSCTPRLTEVERELFERAAGIPAAVAGTERVAP